MEPLASQSSVKLVIKTPNQQVKDIEVSCLLDWTVEKLKGHLSTVYPTKPARSSQKLIYSGKLLDDQIVLKDVLQESEGIHQTVHLVCTPSTSDKSSSQRKAPVSNPVTNSNPSVTSTPTTTTPQGMTQPDGLRHRHHVHAQHPFYNMQFGHPPHYPPHMGQTNIPTNQAGQIPPSPYMFPGNAQYFGAHNMHYAAAAQHMAHMHWMQHMAHMMNGNVHNMQQGFPTMQPQNIPNQQQINAEQVPPQVNQPAAAVQQAPQAQERQENRAQNRNMVMNANAGGAMMQNDEEDEENAQRDWLDYIYMAVRIFMLMSIFWFYSSAERLIVMGLIVFIVWLVQSGVFNLNRARRNRQEVPPVNPANNEPAREEPDDEQDIEEDEDIEGDSDSDSESQEEDQTDNNTNTDNNDSHPGYFVVGYNFFVTFFTSLVPQAPGAVAQP